MKICTKTVIVTLAIIFTQVTTIYSQRYHNGLVDKTIALIGNDMIQLSELETEVQMMMLQGVTSDKNLRCEILQNMLTKNISNTSSSRQHSS